MVATALPTIPNLTVARTDYPAGQGGVDKTISKVVTYILEGRHNALARQFAEGIIQQAGYAPNASLTHRQIGQAFLDYVRSHVRYRPDPHMTETVSHPAVTLCVPGAAACIPVEDCDGGTAVLGWLFTSYGIPVRLLIQHFNSNTDHVLLEIQDDAGSWLACDFSNFNSDNMPIGWKPQAASEYRIDPFDAANLQIAGARDVEFVAVGKIPRVFVGAITRLPPRFVGKAIAKRRVGDLPAFQAAATDLANEVDAVITAGDTYAAATPPELAEALSSYKAAGQAGATVVGPEIDLAGASWVTQPLTHQAWVSNGNLQALTTADASTVAQAKAYITNMRALWQQALSDGTEAILRPGGVKPPKLPGVNNALVWVIGLGLASGLAYAYSTSNPRRRR